MRAGLPAYRTTQFIPIDGTLSYKSGERHFPALKGERDTEALFHQKASDRRAAVNHIICGMMKTVVIGTMTGDAKKWRRLPRQYRAAGVGIGEP